jgi:DNA uptake protein ComE-like DNA-binding protein
MSLRKLIRGFSLLWLMPALSFFLTACGSGAENRQTNTASSNSGNPGPTAASNTPSPATSNTPKAKLNINNAASSDFLTTIPGLGNRMVHEFEEYRPYRSIQQFRREIGKYVDPAQVAEYEKYIFVPIDENQSDALTLQQIPGLDTAEAQELLASRPYASRDAFITQLTPKVSAEELAIAKTYLVQQ